MKVYQVKVGVRGNPTAAAPVLVEANDYKEALIKSIESFSKAHNFELKDCMPMGIYVVEEIKEDNVPAIPRDHGIVADAVACNA